MKRVNREPWFDVVKFLAMWMVVVWHMIDYRSDFDLKKTPLIAANLIVGVNMPLFFMISGFFSRRLHESGDWHKLLLRLVSYFWPLAVFGLIFTTIDSLVLHRIPVAQIPLTAFKRFLFCGWFFYSLAICEVVTFCSYRLPRWRGALLSSAAFVTLVFLNGRFWYSSSTVAMIPFYWFGLCLLPYVLSLRRLFASLAVVGGIAYLGVVICAGNIATNGLGFYWNYLNPHRFLLRDLGLMFARYGLGLAGCLAICGFIRMVSVVFPALVAKLAVFGTCTLGIYFVHGSLIRYFVVPMTHGMPAFPFLLLLATLVFFLSHAFVFKTARVVILNRFLWGRSLVYA